MLNLFQHLKTSENRPRNKFGVTKTSIYDSLFSRIQDKLRDEAISLKEVSKSGKNQGFLNRRKVFDYKDFSIFS
jgi:hypothetical protein